MKSRWHRWHGQDGTTLLESVQRDFEVATTSEFSEGMLLPKLFYVDYDARAHSDCELKYFLKKDEARDYARANGNMPMWSIDKYCADKAAKYFVVGSYERMWQHYSCCARPATGGPAFAPDKAWLEYDLAGGGAGGAVDAAQKREKWLKRAFKVLPFAYEVLMEGVPLHMYLDMEGSKITNPNVNFNVMSGKLLLELQAFLCNMGLGVPQSAIMQAQTVVLDSSTERKFSKHVLFKIPGAVFGNNYICGAIMHHFKVHLERRFGKPDVNPFYIHPFGDAKKQEVKVCVLDYAVYTKFRDFRLIGSCKRLGCAKPNATLRWLWIQNKRGALNKELFMECLIQNTSVWPATWTVEAVYDLRNNGVPCSSSLRTVQPETSGRRGGGVVGWGSAIITSTAVLQSYHCSGGGSDQRPHIQLPQQMLAQLAAMGNEVAGWMTRTREEPMRRYFRDGGKVLKVKLLRLRDGNYAWAMDTDAMWCMMKNGKHTSRTTTFLVWATGLSMAGYDERKVGSIKQQCIANSCTGGIGPSNAKRSTWLGRGAPRELRERINAVLRPCIAEQLPTLGVEWVGGDNPPPPVECQFQEDEEDEPWKWAAAKTK